MSTTKTDRAQRDLAPALTRGIRILGLIANSGRAWSMSEIAREFGLAKSSVHGLCSILASEGLLERTADGTYRLGLRLVDLANARLESSDLPAEFYSAWDSLGLFRQEATVLGVRDRTDMVYIACRNSTLPLGVTFRIGMRLPANCTATGKAILSTLPEDEIRSLYKSNELVRLTKQSISTVDALLKQLEQVHKQGYSVDDGETRDHMCSFGAPVFDRDMGQAIAGVAISFFRSDLTDDKRERAAKVVQEFAATLSKTQGA